MDISKIDDSYKAKLPSSHRASRDNGFKRVFDQKMSEINAKTPKGPSEIKEELLGHSSKILSLLDDYARELTDPTKTLRDIAPLVESIKEEVSLFEDETMNRAPLDNELEGLIKDLVVTSNVAIFKFYRGDYI